MPRYDFRCEECATVFEVERRMSQASAPAICPQCGGERTNKLLALVSFVAGGGTATAQGSQPVASGGGCCGGACGCGGH